MYIRVHNSEKGRIVALCDANLIGKVLEENGVVLDLDRYRSFYVGDKTGAKNAKEALKKFASANIVGENSASLAISMGLATDADVMYIKNVPYIQVYNI